MLSSAERTPRPLKPPVLQDFALRRYGNTPDFPIDIVTISQFSGRAPHVKRQTECQSVAIQRKDPGPAEEVNDFDHFATSI